MATVLPRIPQKARPLLAWVGMAGMVSAVFVTDAHAGFPGPGAALALLSAAVLIAAGTGSSSLRYKAPLTNRAAVCTATSPTRFYLWHFPIIIIGGSIVSETSSAYFALTLAAISVFSIYSYHLFEDPIGKGPWLTGRSHKRRESKFGLPDHYGPVALSALAVLTVVLVLNAVSPQR